MGCTGNCMAAFAERRTIMRLLFFLTLFLSLPAAADVREFASGSTQATLLELFTSEGCSSCPPAEKWLGKLKSDPRLWREIVPLAWHVDYWNYLGWRDPYSSKRWSQRQRDYRRSGGLAAVYTPAFAVNGDEWKGWFGARQIPAPSARTGALKMRLEDGEVSAEFISTDRMNGDWRLHVALLGFGIETTVTAGENAGKQLSHDFVVLDLVEADSVDGHWSLRLPAVSQPQVDSLGLAAWVTKAGDMAPVQVVGGWLP
ncbi:MAG: DUF1223 domain-containing protein [Gammaproteobacteria bacterium]|nr:MAG: DUF1223 domain-containing protein [Gammaproteobacteria bacterium]